MKYKRFKELWMALVQNRKTPNCGVKLPSIQISDHTVDALVSMSKGNSSKFNCIKHFLK